MLRSREGFCEEVSEVVCGRNVLDNDLSVVNAAPNKMVSNVNVLAPRMYVVFLQHVHQENWVLLYSA